MTATILAALYRLAIWYDRWYDTREYNKWLDEVEAQAVQE